MLCLLKPGHLPQPLVQVSETAFAAEISEIASLNHICVFLDGTTPLPEGYSASVHLQLPGSAYQMIGAISNVKPSAIFRLRGTVIPSDVSSFASQASSSQLSAFSAMLGISIEASNVVEAQLQLAGVGVASSSKELVVRANSDPIALATSIAKFLYNGTASFAQTDPNGSAWIELKSLEKSFLALVQKLKSGTGFLSREN